MDRLCNPYIAVHWKNRLVAGQIPKLYSSVGQVKVYIKNMQTAYLTIELSLYFAGMVHRYICTGNLSPEFTAGILNTKGTHTTGMKLAHYLLRKDIQTESSNNFCS